MLTDSTVVSNGRDTAENSEPTSSHRSISVGLMTGGGDRHYAIGLATALTSKGIHVEFIGGDEVDSPELHSNPLLTFWNLRVSGVKASLPKKITRVLSYYTKLLRYAKTTQTQVFHILWNNKFEMFDRTLLMLYYRALRKKIVLTAHNVNAGVRDSNDSFLNRLTLKIQYRLAHHIFVHTEKMRDELASEFGVPITAITTIPYGINNALPVTELTSSEAKQQLGIEATEKAVLFFGNVAPYKGVEVLVNAIEELLRRGGNYRLIIAGRAKKGCEEYVNGIREALERDIFRGHVISRIELVPDEAVEAYFKAADVAVLPYTHIFQSGVLFLAYSFGLPAIVTDVGSLREDVEEGKTGYIVRPRDAVDLAAAIERYFTSDLYRFLDERRQEVKNYTAARHSWSTVGETTRHVYTDLYLART
jgi:glycosyltransferase involved in cell wall biosynthesis